MRRRMIQLLFMLVAVGAMVETGEAQGWWCIEWEACEPTASCAPRLGQYIYQMCCTILDYCASWRAATGNCC